MELALHLRIGSHWRVQLDPGYSYVLGRHAASEAVAAVTVATAAIAAVAITAVSVTAIATFTIIAFDTVEPLTLTLHHGNQPTPQYFFTSFLYLPLIGISEELLLCYAGGPFPAQLPAKVK